MLNAPVAQAITNTNPGSYVDVPVNLVQVSYTFDIASQKSLRLPYAVMVNGKALENCRDSVLRLNCGSGKISVRVQRGDEVALCLNSDAKPGYRKCVVYPVRAGDVDVQVNIKEVAGHRGELPVLISKGRVMSKTRPVEVHEGLLTGRTWMLISHQYTLAEARTLLPSSTDAVIRKAVESIFAGLKSSTLSMTFPDQHTLVCKFLESDNASANIAGFSLLRDGLTRVHPHAFLAAFEAARSARLDYVEFNSNWRPMLGSIAHREGRGFDIRSLKKNGETHLLNRASLLSPGKATGYVTGEEKRLYANYIAAHKAIDASRRKGKVEIDDTKNLDSAKAAWMEAAAKSMPKEIIEFHNALLNSVYISQVFDPWYLEDDTQDNKPPEANDQIGMLAKGHNNHIHLTVRVE